MNDDIKNLDLLDELETAESYLKGDIQQLSYIQDNLEAVDRGERVLDIHFLTNSMETLFKAMYYNYENMKNAVDKVYKLKKLKGSLTKIEAEELKK